MGIELPPDLAPLAAAAGVRWPQADEDAMRAAATAWREAAARMSTLTGDADTTASSALGTFTGDAADAARAHWSGYVGPDSGHLTVTARGCLAAADRLDHAADQVGAAKVEIVRQLVDLAKNTEAAKAVGTPTALLGVDTAVTATAANLASVTETLVAAVAPDGPDVTSARQVAQANPGAPVRGGLLGGVVPAVAGLAEAVPVVSGGSVLDRTVGNVGETVRGAVGGFPAPAHEEVPVGGVVSVATGGPNLVGGVVDAVGGVTDAVHGAVRGSGESAGGVSDAVHGAVRGPGGLVSGVVDVVHGTGQLAGGVTDAVQGAVGGVTDAVQTAVRGTGELTDAVQGAVRGSGEVVGGVTDAVQGAVRGTGEVVGGVTDAVQDAVRGTGEVVGGVADVVDKTVGGVTSAVEGAVRDGGQVVGGAGERAADTAGGVVEGVVDAGPSRPGPADEWAMDLPTPPSGMPVPDTVQAASAAVLDAPAATASPASGVGASPAPGVAGQVGGGGGAVAGAVGAVGGQAGPALPAQRAQSGGPIRAELPQQTESRAGDQRGREPAGDQRGRDTAGESRGKAERGGATERPGHDHARQDSHADAEREPGGFARLDEYTDLAAGQGEQSGVDSGSSGKDDQEPTPATGFGVVPLVGGFGYQAGRGGGRGFGAEPYVPPSAERSGLARLPGVFAGASIGDAHRDQLSLFLLHLFPIGHLPQVVDEPHLQLPAPQAEVDYAAGLRFPPDDHPEARLVDAATPAPVTRTEGGSTSRIASGYDPLGGLHERDWERRFLVRHADGRGRAEYAWPPGEQYPEGGSAHGEPEVLAPGTVIDRVGTQEGRVFAEDATPFAARSLPPGQLTEPLRRYAVVRPLPVWRAASAPWFAQRGGGVRLRATRSAVELVALGYLVEITEDER